MMRIRRIIQRKGFVQKSIQLGKQVGQRGDTIVEVLICIGIVSLILTGAYVTTNRSSLAIRDAQEHAEGLKLAQSQLEQIRQNAGSVTPVVFDRPPNTDFCMINGALATTAAQCLQDASGNPTTNQPQYRVMAQRDTCTVGTNCNKFTVKVEWDSISAKAKASEQIIYRLHRP